MAWGWLKALGKVGAGIAAPFTGGASLAAIPAIDAIGGVASALGGGASAAKEGRMDEAQLQALMNAQNNRAQLEAGTFNQRTQSDLMRRALMSKMLGETQGPSDPRDKFGGPSVSPALQALLSRYGGMADQDVTTGGYRLTPTMSGIPKSGAMEKIGGIAGTAGGLLGALRGLGGRPQVGQSAPQLGPLSANVKKPGLEDVVL